MIALIGYFFHSANRPASYQVVFPKQAFMMNVLIDCSGALDRAVASELAVTYSDAGTPD